MKIQQTTTIRLFKNMRAEAEKRGFLSDKEIEAEIKAARTANKKPKKLFGEKK